MGGPMGGKWKWRRITFRSRTTSTQWQRFHADARHQAWKRYFWMRERNWLRRSHTLPERDSRSTRRGAFTKWSDWKNVRTRFAATTKRGIRKLWCLFVAEREGFEPPVPLSTTVFKTVVIDHSTISPSVSDWLLVGKAVPKSVQAERKDCSLLRRSLI